MLPNEVSIGATVAPDSPVLDSFYAGYDRAFVLPDEKEDIAGFRACLLLNATHRSRCHRAHLEFVAVARDAASGEMLGGVNFLATGMDNIAGHPRVSVALNYLFVETRARGKGLSRALLVAVARLANRAVGTGGEDAWPAIFIEQNDPLLMSPEDYALDSRRSGTDQVDRLRIWNRLGARLVDFPYLQPALSASHQPDRTLAYAAVQFPGDAIAAAFLHDHLESFFEISVLKGRDPRSDPLAAQQLDALAIAAARHSKIGLIDMGMALTRLSDLPQLPLGTTMRDFARTLQE